MKKTQTLPEAEVPEINEYYLRVSKKLRNTKYLMLLLMVAALIFTLWSYRTRLTYDNFRYLLRDIDEAGHTKLASDSVYYSANDTNTFLHFRGDLAVGSSDGISFHRALGNRSFEDKVVFKAPVLCGSNKYMIAYDAGGNSFYVYNSISRVYSETLKHSIIDCAAASNGNFAVLTKNDVGDCVIRMYDKDFNLVGEITREGFVYSIGFLENSRLYLCESYAASATLYTDISFYTVGTENVEKGMTLSGIVLDCQKTDSGFSVIFDSGIAFYNGDGTQKAQYSFGTADILYGDSDKNGACALLDTNEIGEDCSVIACFDDGTNYVAKADSGAKGAVLCGEKVCVLYDEYLLVCSPDENNKIEILDGAKKLLSRDRNSVIVCYNDYAKVYEVK